MKKITFYFISILFLSSISINAFSMGAPGGGNQGGNDCANSQPFCTGTTEVYTAGTNNGTAPAGNNYGCLFTQPNPVWYYMEVDQSGNLEISINNDDGTGSALDIDFAMWGPFADLATATGSCGSLGGPADCSYSGIAVPEVVNVNGCSTGDVYILMITNYSNTVTDVSFTNTGGNATSDCAVLPVELIKFEGLAYDGYNLLQWETATEMNNDYFVIEKSIDGYTYEVVEIITGRGNSNNIAAYSCVHNKPDQLEYYRLKQVDFDGKSKHSRVITVKSEKEIDATIYPNPVLKSLNVSFVSKKEENVTITVTDILGNSFIKKFLIEKGNTHLKIDEFIKKRSGLYFVTIRDESNSTLFSERIIKY